MFLKIPLFSYRWWAVGYGCNESRIRVGPSILAKADAELDRSRNVLKFLLGNLNDFQPGTDAVTYYESLNPVDRYLLHLTSDFESRCFGFYDSWDVDRVVLLADQFLNDAVSGCVHWMKDR